MGREAKKEESGSRPNTSDAKQRRLNPIMALKAGWRNGLETTGDQDRQNEQMGGNNQRWKNS